MPSWKKVIISGSDAALNSLDITQDLTVDTNTLHVDSSNNRVGIGTTSPSYTLDIEKASGEVAIQLQARDNSSNSAIYFGDNSDADVGSLIYNHGSNYMAFTANAGERMRINSTGVGIGTDNPTYQLHVSSSTAALGVYERAGGAALYLEGQLTRGVMGTVSTHPLLIAYNSGEVARFTGTSFDVTGSLNVGTGTDINLIGGGNLETNGGNVNTTGGSINIGGGAVNGTIPGSAVNVDVVTATIKNFVIDHPTPEKEGYKLRHSSLEGPEAGVYFRGKSTSNIIDLPDYWVDLVEEESITVNLTSFGSPCQHYIEDIRDNQVIIGCACGTPNYHFTVYGERKDVEKLVVEYKEEKYL